MSPISSISTSLPFSITSPASSSLITLASLLVTPALRERLVYVNFFDERLFNLQAARLGELGRQPYTARDFFVRYQDRILFGSDFPLIPYDYDEERRWAWDRGLPPEVRRKIFHDNAAALLGLA